MRLFVLILLLATNLAYAQKDTYTGTLEKEEFAILKAHLKANFKIEMDSLSLLVIEYTQPKSLPL